MKHPNALLNSSAIVLAAIASVYGQDKPRTPPATGQAAAMQPAAEPGTLNSIFNGKLPDAIGKSKININSRLRWEYADQDAAGGGADPDESNAFTIRTRFGITSAPLYGFQAMLEGENVTVIGPDHNYNAAGSNANGAGKTIIADPPTTELNQAWLSYSNWDSKLKGGRQHFVLDNHRFVGDVGWRQNQQTFDAIAVENKSIEDLTFTYGYLWEVNRVFGDVGFPPPPSPAAGSADFESDSHVFNVSYSGWKYGRFVGYTYLLDLENVAGNANSCATYGGYFAGSAPLSEKVSLNYRAEAAWQTDYADSPQDYQAEYYNVELGATVKPVAFGAGYEVLGTDSNDGAGPASVGFRTPLATLHAFNGWADVFLATPAKGLRDLYGYAQVTLPGEFPLRFVYHKFDADSGGGDFGQEFDVLLSKKLGKHWTALAKYAFYDAEDLPYADVQKFWLQLEFNF